MFLHNTAIDDYSSLTPSTLSFTGADGEVQCLSIPIVNDIRVERNETLSVRLLTTSSDSGFINFDQDTTTVTIRDDDTVLIGWDPVLYTPNEEEGSVSVCARIMQGQEQLDRDVFVTYATVDGTAQGNNRNISVSGTCDVHIYTMLPLIR